MGHGRNLRRGFVQDETPTIQPDQVIGRVTELRDKGIVSISIPSIDNIGLTLVLAYLPPRFRGVLFLRRGAFVLLSPATSNASEKVAWSIEALLRVEDTKQLRKEGKWPISLEDPLRVKDKESCTLESESESESEIEESESKIEIEESESESESAIETKNENVKE